MIAELYDGALARSRSPLRAMFQARKEVFVDLLGWDVPVSAEHLEIDQFDNADARYLVLSDEQGRHRASSRLLRTDRPHLLADCFAHLCSTPPPAGPTVREITRFCLDRHRRAAERRLARNRIVTALSWYAMNVGITAYTGVADQAWFEQICTFGWDCEALGRPARHGNSWIVALHIAIAPDTLERLHKSDIFAPVPLTMMPFVMADAIA
ncbi:acyl-homoserine-lactone synthase [Novosphingobium sp. 9]|uniref:acyl-homoserine-lactone synthase n=1 Tax=Novosphingobium sp. 9 TaxID=2025349 RepID=UPI0021B67A5D|nr:acyl-homoserine-lactone synthase [Novosphingobium sp. 9]